MRAAPWKKKRPEVRISNLRTLHEMRKPHRKGRLILYLLAFFFALAAVGLLIF